MFDEFDSHVTDWLAQLPRGHERNRDEQDMGDWFVALCERDDDKANIKRLEATLTQKALAQSELLALPVVAVGVSGGVDAASNKVWTPERLAIVKTYRDKHGTKKAAEHFGISEQLIRKKLPSEKLPTKGHSVFTHRAK